MRNHLILFLALLTFAGLTACGDTSAEVTSTEVEAQNPGASPEASPPAADQIEFTRNVDEATVAREKLEQAATEAPPVKLEEPKPASPVDQRTDQAEETRTDVKTAKSTSNPPPPPPAPVSEPTEEPVYNDGIGRVGSKPQTAPAPEPELIETVGTIFPGDPPSHAAFDQVLNKYVNDQGLVNYAALKRNQTKLDAYLKDLAASLPADDWSRNERLAYWINAYNAFTLKLIVDNYPTASITDLHGGEPWKEKWIKLGGETYSLNQIEHDIIRPKFNEPRIHFAVVCAAQSCPPLANQAYTAKNLDRLLTTRTRAFIRNPAFNEISGKTVRISKIFDWYGEDFGDVRAYLNEYLPSPIPAGADIQYKDYDWSLNKQ